jgi:hypothetical protein
MRPNHGSIGSSTKPLNALVEIERPRSARARNLSAQVVGKHSATEGVIDTRLAIDGTRTSIPRRFLRYRRQRRFDASKMISCRRSSVQTASLAAYLFIHGKYFT